MAETPAWQSAGFASPAAYTAALRRRRRLLADEHYGPIYARLPARETARVDALVEAGDTAGARTLLDQLDTARRTAERERRTRQLRERAVIRIMTVLRPRNPNPDTVAEGVAAMGRTELEWTIKAEAVDIARQASDPNRQRPDTSGIPRNPWWYH